MDNLNIDQELLVEQLDFLTKLATDIDLGLVALTDAYTEMKLSAVEYLDGLCNLLDEINELLGEWCKELEEERE